VNEPLSSAGRGPGGEAAQGLSLLSYARVAARRYKVIVSCTLIAALVGLGLSFVLPRVYRAEATIYVPPNPAGGLSAVLRGLALSPGISDALASRNQSDVANYLIAVLESRALAADVAKTLDLKRHRLFACYSAKQGFQPSQPELLRRSRLAAKHEPADGSRRAASPCAPIPRRRASRPIWPTPT